MQAWPEVFLSVCVVGEFLAPPELGGTTTQLCSFINAHVFIGLFFLFGPLWTWREMTYLNPGSCFLVQPLCDWLPQAWSP
jgi:hypothetical protein